MANKLHNIDDKARYEEAYRGVGACGEAFFFFAPNIPKNLSEVVKDIHGGLNRAAYWIFQASNTYDLTEKVEYLDQAHNHLFALQSSFYYLVKAHGVTVGQANVVIDKVRVVYEQVNSWKNTILKEMSKAPADKSSGREVRR